MATLDIKYLWATRQMGHAKLLLCGERYSFYLTVMR